MKPRFLLAAALLSLGMMTLWLRHAPTDTTAPEPITEIGFQPTALRVAARGLARTANPTNYYQRLATALDAESDPAQREEQLPATVAAITDTEVPAALAALTDSNSPSAAELRALLATRWAEQNPAAAAAWAGQLPPGPVRNDLLQQIAIPWAESDLPAVTDWVAELPATDPAKSEVSLAVAYEAARTNALIALQLAAPLPASRERDDFLIHAVRQWTEADAATVGAWIASIPDPALQQRLTAAFAVALSQADSSAAATLASTSLPSGSLQNRTTVAIVQQWAQTDPTSAAHWVEQFPAGALRDSATQNLLSLWTLQNPDAAGQWAASLTDSTLRQSAQAAYQVALNQRAIETAAHAADAD